MKIMFRPQRGGFDESMALVEEFKSIDALLYEKSDGCFVTYYCYDERLQAETFIVSDSKNRGIGFCWFISA